MELSKSKIEYFTFDKFQIVEKFYHSTTLACFAQAQPLRRVRVFDILLGKKAGEGGVGGNRWQVANANGNSLTIWDLL